MAKQVHIRVDDTTYEELNEYSTLSGQSMQDYLSVAIRQLLVKREKMFHAKRQIILLSTCSPESVECVLHTKEPEAIVYIQTSGTGIVRKHILPILANILMAISRK